MEGGVAKPDTQPVRDDIAALREAVLTLETTIGRAMEEIGISGAVTPDTKAQLRTDLKTVLDCCGTTIRDAVDLLVNTNFGALRVQNLETLRKILSSLRSAMGSFADASGHFSNAMNDLTDAMGTLREINAHMSLVFEQLDEVLANAQQASASLTSAFTKPAQWARELSGEDPGSFSGLGTEFGESSDALNAALGGISNELTALNGEMSNATSVLLADVRAINNQFMKVMNLFLNVLNNTRNVDYTDVYEDVSEESLQSATRGKVLECINYGSVDADRNVGGVAGSMAIEYDLDPEDDLLSSEHRTTRFTYQTRAILLDCDNYGAVQAKKSCAGGLVGRMDLGTVSGCGGYGAVSSENGDYVGGVCGLTDYTQLAGAVAGEITGDYSGNCFVSDTLAGVDRVSYAGKAEQITYEAMREREDAPDQFRRLTLRFVSEGRTLKTQQFDYGASFGSDVYPELPEKEDSYVHWDRSDLRDLRLDTDVTAVYEPYVTTLSSKEKRDGRAVLLVQGSFREGDALQAAKTDTAMDNAVEAWSIQIPDDGQESHTVRWLMPDKEERYTAYVDSGTGEKKTDCQTNGSYLCFTMDGSGTVTIVSTQQLGWWIWAVGGAAVAAVAVLAFVTVRRRKSASGKREVSKL